ncbi:MAG: SGNH/GDSL hydrolase family protein [Clostridia bacterium]|nr:SGNH/GDSL hydrolase family protein [Clostridia bacterium]
MVNVYDKTKAINGYWDKNGTYSADGGFRVSDKIAVKEGDLITFGAAVRTQGWHITLFGADGVCLGTATIHNGLRATHELTDGGVIMAYTVGSGVAHIRMVCDKKYADVYLVTVNHAFGVDEYNEFFSLTPTAPDNAELTNLFDLDKVEVGHIDKDGTKHNDQNFRVTDHIKVKAGDVLTFGPAVETQGWHMVLCDASGKVTGSMTVSKGIVMTERFGDGTAIMKYTVGAGVASVRVIVDAKYIDSYLLTLNQPFGKNEFYAYNEMEIPKEDQVEVKKDSPLYGKSALYCGDSISYGHYDTIPGTSWAGRLEKQYGLDGDNRSKSGWCLSTVRGQGGQIVNQLKGARSGDYDFVVLEGGVNDAWGATDGSGVYAPVGKMTDSFDVKDYDVTTFAGGLEELFWYAKEYFPDAQIVYISMFDMPKAPASTNRVSDMDDYYAEAEKICEKWGVAYLDLYNNAELSAALNVQQGSNAYLQDPVHPTAKGYDVMTPYIADFLEGLAE